MGSSSHSCVTQAVLALVLSLGSALAGYQLGLTVLSSKASSGNVLKDEKVVEKVVEEAEVLVVEEVKEEEEEDVEAEDIPDGDLAAVSAGFLEPCKMVLVVRTDLKMNAGTIASQCAHATLACYKALSKTNSKLVHHWEYTGQAKIALKAKSEDQLLELEAIAKSLNLCARAVQDPTLGENVRTVLAIGPAPVNLINEVTGKLRLL